MKTTSPRGRFVLTSTLMLTQTMGWGMTFSQIGVLSEPIAQDTGLSQGVIFAGATVMYIAAALSAPMAGRLADRHGGLKLLAPGSVVLGAGLFGLSFATEIIGYMLAWFTFGVVLHVGLVTAAFTGLTQTMGAASVRAIGTLTLATGLCSSIFWPVSEFALQHLDWRSVCQTYGAVTILFCAPLHLWLARRFGHLRAGGKDSDVPEAFPHIRPGHEKAGFTLQTAIACCGSFITVGFGLAVIDIYTTLGLPRGEAVYAGSLIGVAFVISRGLATLWADRISTPQMAKIVYCALPLSFLPLLYVGLTEVALPVWSAVGVSIAFGLPAGLVGVLRPTFPLYLFGTQSYGTILGRQARATELASAVSPAALSSLLALSATGAVGALAGVGALALIGTWRVGRHTVEEPLKTA